MVVFDRSQVMRLCVSEQPKVAKSDGQSGKQIHIPNLLRLIYLRDKCVCVCEAVLSKYQRRITH